MSPDRWDAVVVGGGPAGSLAALLLARAGRRVLLVDRAAFPRDKVCGDCLHPRAAELLSSVGLADLPRRLGAVPLTRLRWCAGGRAAELPLARGWALSRRALDHALLQQAAAAGATVELETSALLAPPDGGLRRLRLTGAESRDVAAAVVIAADGLGGRLLARAGEAQQTVAANSRVGAGARLPGLADVAAGCVVMACGRGGYAGLVRVEDGGVNAAAALGADWIEAAGSLGDAAAAILERAGAPGADAARRASWRGTPLLTRRPSSVAAGRVFAIGDAAGYVEPFTGEGMAWAMETAAAAAPLALRAIDGWDPALAEAWQRRHRRVTGARRAVCAAAAALLRSEPLTAAAVRALSGWPAAGGLLVERLHHAGAPQGLVEGRRP